MEDNKKMIEKLMKQYILYKIKNGEKISYEESQYFMTTEEGQWALSEVINNHGK